MVGGKIFDEDMTFISRRYTGNYISKIIHFQKYKYTHTCTKSMHEKENNQKKKRNTGFGNY